MRSPRLVDSPLPRTIHRSTQFRFLRAAAALIGVFFVSPLGFATSNTWDGGGVNGLWTNAINWVGDTNVPGGASGTASGDTATFNNAVNTTVTVDAARNVKNITFDTASVGAFTFSSGGLVVTNNGAITITSTAANSETINTPITLSTTPAATYSFINNSTTGGVLLTIGGTVTGGTGSGTETLTVGGSGNGTATNTISDGTGHVVAVTKTDGGTWTFSGANTYLGSTTLSGGTLALDYSTNNTSKLSDAAALILAGGTLQLSGGSHTEIIGTTTLNSGASSVTRPSGTSVLRMNTITRNAGSSINFAAGSIADTDTLNSNGILGGYATVGATAGSADWAMNSTNGLDGAITAFTSYSAFATTGTNANNELLTGSSTLTGTSTTNSLKINSSGAGQLLNIVNGQTLTLTSGGLMFIGANDYQISNGTLKSGTATNSDLIVQQWGAGNLTIGSVIANGTGASTLTKAGTGTLILTGASTYNGLTTINTGTLSLNDNGATTPRLANTSGVTVNSGGTLLLSGSTSSSDRINNSANVTINGGGKFSTGGLTEGTRPTGPAGSGGVAGLGALTLSGTSGAASTIDFGSTTAGSSLVFSSLTTASKGAFVSILNWGGTANTDNGTSTFDRLLFAADPGFSTTDLANFAFSGFANGAVEIAYGGMFEIVPIPEPSTWINGALVVALLGWTQRSRITRQFQKART